jgi:hypothetical protein
MTDQTRLPRELMTRNKMERPKQWTPPELLPEPDKEEGMSYRWIRVSLNMSADPKNISSRFREGWEPVKLEEQPQFQLLVDPDSRFKDHIEIGGLLLCKTPTELVNQQQEYYLNLTRKNEDAVNNSLMRQSDARMPLFREGKSSVSFGTGK